MAVRSITSTWKCLTTTLAHADVIEHFIHSPKHPISEFFRVLKPGGVCVATTPNAVRLGVRLRVLLGISNWPHVAGYYHEGYHSGHHHEYSAEELKHVFVEAGFEIVRLTFDGTVTTVAVSSLSELQPQRRQIGKGTHLLINFVKGPVRVMERLVPSLRRTLLLTARKPAHQSTLKY